MNYFNTRSLTCGRLEGFKVNHSKPFAIQSETYMGTFFTSTPSTQKNCTKNGPPFVFCTFFLVVGVGGRKRLHVVRMGLAVKEYNSLEKAS